MATVLQPVETASAVQRKQAALQFIEWTVAELTQARSTANTVNIYTNPVEEVRLDFARPARKGRVSQHDTQSHGRYPRSRPNRQQQAAVAVIKPPHSSPAVSLPPPPSQGHSHSQSHVQRGRNHSQSSGPSRQLHIPRLETVGKSTNSAEVREWAKEVMAVPGLDPRLVTALRLELAGGDTSIHGFASKASQPVPAKVAAVSTDYGAIISLIKMRYIHPQRQCLFCSHNADPAKNHHNVRDCPTVQKCLQHALPSFLQAAENDRCLAILPPLSDKDRKRSRYAAASAKSPAHSRKSARAPQNIT